MTQTPTSDAKPTRLPGIDVSHHNKTINWTKVKESGKVVFAICKATEHTNFTDPQLTANWRGMEDVGIIRTSYHFFRANRDAATQAQRYLDAMEKVGGFKAGDLPPVLDLESTDDQSDASMRAGALTWLRIVEEATGRIPILYTGSDFSKHRLSADFARFPLWIANYNTTKPGLPTWAPKWVFWQCCGGENSDAWVIPGIVSDLPGVDGNWFNGTLEDLKALCGSKEPYLVYLGVERIGTAPRAPQSGRAMYPVRPLLNRLIGDDVAVTKWLHWDKVSGTFTWQGRPLKDKKGASIYGTPSPNDGPVWAPLRDIAEAFGARIDVDEMRNTITITRGGGSPAPAAAK